MKPAGGPSENDEHRPSKSQGAVRYLSQSGEAYP